jgi:hypothetical protein
MKRLAGVLQVEELSFAFRFLTCWAVNQAAWTFSISHMSDIVYGEAIASIYIYAIANRCGRLPGEICQKRRNGAIAAVSPGGAMLIVNYKG